MVAGRNDHGTRFAGAILGLVGFHLEREQFLGGMQVAGCTLALHLVAIRDDGDQRDAGCPGGLRGKRDLMFARRQREDAAGQDPIAFHEKGHGGLTVFPAFEFQFAGERFTGGDSRGRVPGDDFQRVSFTTGWIFGNQNLALVVSRLAAGHHGDVDLLAVLVGLPWQPGAAVPVGHGRLGLVSADGSDNRADDRPIIPVRRANFQRDDRTGGGGLVPCAAQTRNPVAWVRIQSTAV